ncbi:aminopeptidase [Flavobacterium magnum]|uniref:Aminopeptidase n=1 Tax=Flavobacterium magnum TaxID=2162713 RepID=A0A2S0RK05_9FLAO|nr:aminopeptidase [Flavobacterium magnum]AWA31481.1 aminopeptidase [Flavobacterium magnum]
MSAVLDTETRTLSVTQQLVYVNDSNDTLQTIVLNNWIEAYASKDTPLAKRFSDEFIRSFHLAKNNERGGTDNLEIHFSGTGAAADWFTMNDQPDLVEVNLPNRLLPGEKTTFEMTYLIKVPSDKFTGYGYGPGKKLYLRNCFLSPARFENHHFVKYSNNNSDDMANAPTDYDVTIATLQDVKLFSDLDEQESGNPVRFVGKKRNDFVLFSSDSHEMRTYKNDVTEVVTDLKDNNIDEIRKALLIDKIVHYVDNNIGRYPYEKIMVTQADYERNPFYGLNQLPAFISPFPNDFLYEVKFLKTYLNNFLKNSLRVDPRADNWIYDGFQVYFMMKYIDENYPGIKMMGHVSKLGLFKSYNLTQLDFNGQYSYFYMLMARKNLDQPIGAPKNTLIKFNEQIAGKYRAGLSFRYLADYIGKDNVEKSITAFYCKNQTVNRSARDTLETILKAATDKDIDWFFKTIIDSREIVDYKFGEVSKTKDSVTFTVKNKTGTTVPIPVYGVRNKEIVFKRWLEGISTDSTFTMPRESATKLVLNYNNEVPEYNLRNNWRSLKDFRISNRPIKFVFMKDLEDPYYNQILYVPTLTYNLYDGLSPGFRFHNKTILDKPFVFDVNPIYSPNNQSLVGNFSFAVNQNNRDSNLFGMRYQINGSYFHYAPESAYFKLTPIVFMKFRDPDLRSNHKQTLVLRNVIVKRNNLPDTADDELQNYSVFNAKFIDGNTEATKHFGYTTDLQLSKSFGKASVDMQFRKLFNDNRQISLRLYAGTFLYNRTDDDYFSFGLDRPTDYLFDYDFYGRSEKSGLFSQQLIIAEGGFKSKFGTPFANQWITTANVGFNIWNWVEVYGDAGFVKNRFTQPEFLYDSGIRLNLVTDYFELYFPVYSSNGWEVGQPNYNEKIRFVVTLDPRLLVNLFTRKWF